MTEAQSDDLRSALREPFLRDADWSHLLRNHSEEQISEAISGCGIDFWSQKPIALSAGYHLFGYTTVLRGAADWRNCVTFFQNPEFDSQTASVALYWALTGSLSSSRPVSIEELLKQTPQHLWPAVVRAVISTDGTSMAESLKTWQLLFENLTGPKTYQDRVAQMMPVVTQWIIRDPLSAIAWFKTPEGKLFSQYTPLLANAIAAAVAVDPNYLDNIRKSVNFDDSAEGSSFAVACHQAGATPEQICRIFESLPTNAREKFANAYADVLKKGSDQEILEFIEKGDPIFFGRYVSEVFGGTAMDHSAELFEKLFTKVSPEDRNTFLDNAHHYSSRSIQSSLIYLANYKGIHVGQGHDQEIDECEDAIDALGSLDINAAVAFSAKLDPEEKNTFLLTAYKGFIGKIVQDGGSIEQLLASASAIPPEYRDAVVSNQFTQLLRTPKDALKFLKAYPNAPSNMWEAFFENADMPTEEVSSILSEKLQTDTNPNVYLIGAVRITSQIASRDIGEAQNSIEALPDGPVKQACTNQLIDAWSKKDPVAAIAYLSGIPSGDRRDQALFHLYPNLSFSPEYQAQALTMASSETAKAEIANPKTSK